MLHIPSLKKTHDTRNPSYNDSRLVENELQLCLWMLIPVAARNNYSVTVTYGMPHQPAWREKSRDRRDIGMGRN